MKVYLAAQYSWKRALQGNAETLDGIGIDSTSRWLQEKYDPEMTIAGTDGDWAQIARMDLEDIQEADMLIHFTVPETTPTLRGGRHVECGYALALGKQVVIVGPKENIFYHLPEVKQFSCWGDCYQWLRGQVGL